MKDKQKTLSIIHICVSILAALGALVASVFQAIFNIKQNKMLDDIKKSEKMAKKAENQAKKV